MRKWNTLFLMLALLLVPAAGSAQELPELFSAVYSGAKEGLQSGMQQAAAGMERELTLGIAVQNAKIEEGKTVTLTITAENPRPVDTPVTFKLLLPQRLTAGPDANWQAVLPAAALDEKTGKLAASVSTFTREITLAPGGGSETAELQCEMNMGTRFYRSTVQLQLCVSDVTAKASVAGAQEGRLYPGDHFSYELEINNAGSAPKDTQIRLHLPSGVMPDGTLPVGFTMEDGVVSGCVRAEAAKAAGDEGVPSSVKIELPVVVDENVLEDDEDAVRLLSGALRVDDERVPLPRLQVCGAKISAHLVADTHTLKDGEKTQLRVVVMNAGLAPANVRLSCVLPEGLRLAGESKEEQDQEDKPKASASVQPPDDGTGAAPEAVTNADEMLEAEAATASPDNSRLMYDVHMPAGRQTEEGVAAAARVIRLDVQADYAQENLDERLVGTALAWRVDEGEMQLGEAVAMRLRAPAFMGISKDDWNALLWASGLLVLTVVCLCAAAGKGRSEEDFCCD